MCTNATRMRLILAADKELREQTIGFTLHFSFDWVMIRFCIACSSKTRNLRGWYAKGYRLNIIIEYRIVSRYIVNREVCSLYLNLF